ncbi:hypothetical protein M422DRAFT_775935 [Sphaerobolus stellatus SS14]|nr:hypothetical protein M422DRAFT_775935 [Sphaerobolus stellatus SS14]
MLRKRSTSARTTATATANTDTASPAGAAQYSRIVAPSHSRIVAPSRSTSHASTSAEAPGGATSFSRYAGSIDSNTAIHHLTVNLQALVKSRTSHFTPTLTLRGTPSRNAVSVPDVLADLPSAPTSQTSWPTFLRSNIPDVLADLPALQHPSSPVLDTTRSLPKFKRTATYSKAKANMNMHRWASFHLPPGCPCQDDYVSTIYDLPQPSPHPITYIRLGVAVNTTFNRFCSALSSRSSYSRDSDNPVPIPIPASHPSPTPLQSKVRTHASEPPCSRFIENTSSSQSILSSDFVQVVVQVVFQVVVQVVVQVVIQVIDFLQPSHLPARRSRPLVWYSLPNTVIPATGMVLSPQYGYPGPDLVYPYHYDYPCSVGEFTIRQSQCTSRLHHFDSWLILLHQFTVPSNRPSVRVRAEQLLDNLFEYSITTDWIIYRIQYYY